MFSAGLLENVVHVATHGLNQVPSNVVRAMQLAGNKKFSRVLVCRQPINSVLKAVTEVVSSSSLPSTTYHVYQVIVIGDIAFRIDKNERVEVVTHRKNSSGMLPTVDTRQNMRVFALKVPVTTEQYFANAEKECPVGATFWQYDPVEANCQLFVYWCLRGNGVKLSLADEKFILQKVSINKVGKRKLKTITNLANAAKQVVFGSAGNMDEEEHRDGEHYFIEEYP